ncbi:hypothetical protein PWEIH_14931 [Listeria weihenstephanensis FSL R9-0317]|uniref:Uncharacterized protein n=1 Tax=Listeria weihenstephanensis TaxID=1006155 RepID=A0A1S7FVK8_9LIST|nr:hypothetical protein [Listeria weihenstephanensis]AQY51486.1 hypothetical protein UE46_10865 [Listeria weihenstephanensis]EUJ35848.1 hypothetical protein PWEIH_14931 [Listeria weihenstephanensis FSL R9-0317]
MKKNKVFRNLSIDYRLIFADDTNLTDYKNYYAALVNFINKNRPFFTPPIMEKWGLDVLVAIDPNEYVVEKPDLSLDFEKIRLGGDYKNIDSLAMSIRETLWDLVTIYSGKDCPITPNDELRYIKIRKDDNSEQFLLECAGCGRAEDIYGNEYVGGVGKMWPVNRVDMNRYLK